MEKGFGELLTDSFAIIKKSYIDLLKIIGIFLGGGFLGLISMYLIMGKDFVANMHNSVYVQNFFNSQPKYMLFLLLIFLFFLVLSYISYSWTILVVRNQYLTGTSLLKEAFLETIKKSWKVILAFILMWIIFLVFTLLDFFIPFAIFNKQQNMLLVTIIFVLLFFISAVFIMPFCFTLFYGSLCGQGRIWHIFWASFVLGLRKCFKIIAYMIGVFIVMSVVTSVIMGILLSIVLIFFKSSSLNILLNIPFYLSGFLSVCFYTVFYLDLAGIKPMEQNNPLQNHLTQSN